MTTLNTFAEILALHVPGAVRTAICAECGTAYEQEQLSAEAVRQRWGDTALDACERDIPELWTPVFCPRCERRNAEEIHEERAKRAMELPPPPGSKDERVPMTQEHFAPGFHSLLVVFNPPGAHDKLSQEYFKALSHPPALTDREFDRAVHGAIRTLKFWPKPAELRELGAPP
jgi:hypothetical protein